MIRVSKLLLEAPKALAGGKTGMERSPKTDPTAIPGGMASTPKTSPGSAPKTPEDGHRPKNNPGAVTYGPKAGGSMVRVSKILTRFLEVEEDHPGESVLLSTPWGSKEF